MADNSIPPVRASEQAGPLGDPTILGVGKTPAVDAQGGSGNALQFAIELRAGKTLLDLLKPGEVVSGRVVEQLDNGSYVFTIRGRTVIADSAVPLLRDSVVQFEVLQPSDGEQVRLRPLANQPETLAQRSDKAQRLQQLGLPNTDEALTVLRAFEQAEAPLVPERMQAAIVALKTAPMTPEQTAAVHATLAKANLPVSEATTAIAQRAVEPHLPNLASAIDELKEVARTIANAPGMRQEAEEPRPADPATTQPTKTGTPLPISQTTMKAALDFITRLSVPDPGRDGAPAVAKALALIGIIPANSRESVTADSSKPEIPRDPRIPTDRMSPAHNEHRALRDLPIADEDERILHRLAPLAAASTESESTPLRHVMRELASETVFKPSRLADYDIVVGLPLQDRGLPTPARLAVARREAGGVSATYLRVDAELSQLGPVSVRLSGTDNAPVAINVFVTPRARAVVEDVVPTLEKALNDLGIVASVRVADLDEAELGSGVGS